LGGNDFIVAGIVAACVFGGALVGMFAGSLLPEHHVSKPTEDAVKLGMGTIATLTALVIGLLVASTRGSLEAKSGETMQLAADLVLLDRQLVRYGPEMHKARDLLRRYTRYKIDSTWPGEATTLPDDRGELLVEEIQDHVRALTPTSEVQRWRQERALQVSVELARTRWLLDVQRGSSIQRPFLVVVVSCLTVVFGSFGLFAPRNGTVVAAMALCALSVAGAIFLILEMDRPFTGLIRIPSAPMREALARLEG
jgi:hypothetical protein